MGAIIGVIVGYVLGARAGEKGYQELKEAWKTISTSEEVRTMLSGGLAALSDSLRHGRSMLAERRQSSDGAHALSRVA